MARKKSAEVPLRRSCGAMAAHMMLLEQISLFPPRQMRLEGATERRRDLGHDLAKTKLVTIKTVVNVVYKTPEQNISDAQINSQIRGPEQGLSRDQPRQEQDARRLGRVWSATRRCNFKLVKITRTKTTKNGFAFDDAVKKASTGGIAPFSPKTHLNLWVCALTGGLLGYAQFPGGPPGDRRGGDQLSRRSGRTARRRRRYNKGRTATHEIGHYFNLRHIWGDTPDCSGSDMVADTPNCAGPNFGAPTLPVVTCNNGPNGDMFMNYMDYTDDAAMFMFTCAAGAPDANRARNGAHRSDLARSRRPSLRNAWRRPAVRDHLGARLRGGYGGGGAFIGRKTDEIPAVAPTARAAPARAGGFSRFSLPGRTIDTSSGPPPGRTREASLVLRREEGTKRN